VIYMLSDFALSPRSRVSKLVAMLATCASVIGRLEIKLVQRIDTVVTTAFTDQPVSMKYRASSKSLGAAQGRSIMRAKSGAKLPTESTRVVPALCCKRASQGCACPT